MGVPDRGPARRRGGLRLGAILAGCGLLASSLWGAGLVRYEKHEPRDGHLIRAVRYEKWLRRNYCGPACLAMVLNFGAGPGSFSQRAIADEIFDAQSQASYNSELVLYPRLKGFLSFSCRGDLRLLKELIRNDIPVIVLTRAHKRIAKGHYRVVIGYDDAEGLIILHDPYFGGRLAMTTRGFSKAWELGPGQNRSRWMMAVFPGQGPGPDAFAGLRDDPLTAINLATAYYRRGEFGKSREEWAKAREGLLGDPLPVFSLAMVDLREGRFDEAEALAREALRLDPRSPQAHDVLGLAFAAQGRILEALRALGQALRLDPKQAYIRGHYLQARAFYIDRARAEALSKKE